VEQAAVSLERRKGSASTIVPQASHALVPVHLRRPAGGHLGHVPRRLDLDGLTEACRNAISVNDVPALSSPHVNLIV
jgi:hypothetical protein